MSKKLLLCLLVVIVSVSFLSCGGTSGGNGHSGCPPSTIGGPGNPEISFTYVPAKGSSDHVRGRVQHVKTDDFQIALYIYTFNGYSYGWWTKPTWANPTTPINNCDGSWESSYGSGGNDVQATKIAAFLIPKSYSPPPASGEPNLPGGIESRATAKVFASR